MSTKASLTIDKEALTVRDAVFDLFRELSIRTIFGNPRSRGWPSSHPGPRSSDIYQTLRDALQRQSPPLIDIQIDPIAGDLY